MGFLQKFLGGSQNEHDENEHDEAAVISTPLQTDVDPMETPIPPEYVGLKGELDRNGLAKRVALSFDNDPELQDIDTLYVAQMDSKVILKGVVPSQRVLDRMVQVAQGIDGTETVDTSQVTVE